MNRRTAKLKAARVVATAANAEEYARSFAFALTDHDGAHQEHFRAQAIAWAEALLKELRR